ncbi:MAG: S-layer protein [Methanosarcinaceae archaeon]|nr:S-layer protein [Methanosarcinaceae archaeon]
MRYIDYLKFMLMGLIIFGSVCAVVSAQASTGDRIWDADANQSLEYVWNSKSYSGFYYDLDSGEGSETLTIKLDSKTDRSIDDGELIYTTKPINTNFEHDDWGSYQFIGFMAERYFAAFTEDTEFAGKSVSLMSDGQLSKVLLDDDEEISFFSGSSLALEEGYELHIIEVDLGGDKVFVSLTKDGKDVDSGVVSSNDDYVYETDLGSSEDVPAIAVHFNDIFRGTETNAVFVEGIFQISDKYIEVESGKDFGKMTVQTVSATEIKMDNEDSIPLSKGKIIPIMGKLNFVVADDDTLRFGPFVDISEPGEYQLRGTVAENGVLKWTPLNFEGFYYNIDEGIGTESLEIRNIEGRVIEKGNLLYSTTAEQVSFDHGDWGEFEVIGFHAEKYFAGYPDNEFTNSVSMLSEGQLSKVLIDNDKKSTIVPDSSLLLEEGYELDIVEVDLDGNKVLVSLTKNSKEVDSGIVSSNDDYVYDKDIGSAEDVPLIVVHFSEIFLGRETNAVFVEGIFQISEKYETVDNGERYGKMEVTRIDAETIEMENDKSISLSKDDTVSIMGDISLKIADSNNLRYYPFVTVTTEPSKSLVIEMLSTLIQDDTTNIKVTFRGAAVSDALVIFGDDEIGLTSEEGILNYTPKEIGKFKVISEKEGFISASKIVEVISSQDENKTIVIEVSPFIVYEGDTISISTIKAIGSDPVAGIHIFYDGVSIGNTSSQGTLSYTVKDPGIHKITSTHNVYLGAELILEVLAHEAEFEFYNLLVTPIELDSEKTASISIAVKNTGTSKGDINVELLINDIVTDSKTITLNQGEEKTVEFIYMFAEPGTYDIQIGTEKSTYNVTKEIPFTGFLVSMLAMVFAVLVLRRIEK